MPSARRLKLPLKLLLIVVLQAFPGFDLDPYKLAFTTQTMYDDPNAPNRSVGIDKCPTVVAVMADVFQASHSRIAFCASHSFNRLGSYTGLILASTVTLGSSSLVSVVSLSMMPVM